MSASRSASTRWSRASRPKGDFCSPNGEKCFARIAELIRKTKEYKHIRVVTVSGQIFGNSGSTIVEELAFVACGRPRLPRTPDGRTDVTIEEAGTQAALLVGSVSSNYFMEIAKFRAARMLWANIVKRSTIPQTNCACQDVQIACRDLEVEP